MVIIPKRRHYFYDLSVIRDLDMDEIMADLRALLKEPGRAPGNWRGLHCVGRRPPHWVTWRSFFKVVTIHCGNKSCCGRPGADPSGTHQSLHPPFCDWTTIFQGAFLKKNGKYAPRFTETAYIYCFNNFLGGPLTLFVLHGPHIHWGVGAPREPWGHSL
jgi:hypothetical protein